jgi:hypothetical protein
MLAVFAGLWFFQGCPVSVTGPTESSARSKIETELNKWVAGDRETKAADTVWRANLYEPPLSYRIRNVFPTKPDLSVDAFVALSKKDRPGDNGKAFRFNVDVDFPSKAGTVLTQVRRYTLTWVECWNDWDVKVENE